MRREKEASKPLKESVLCFIIFLFGLGIYLSILYKSLSDTITLMFAAKDEISSMKKLF